MKTTRSPISTLPRGRWQYAAVLAALLTGCASYQPKPLDTTLLLPRDAARIRVDASRMPLPALAAHRFDPSDGLDMDEVAMLAVANNPLLKVERDRLGVARAQAFAAGLLPDPQLGVTRDFPQNGGPGNTSAFSASVGLDVGALLTHSARAASAAAGEREVDLQLLWLEWQVVGQARLLFVRNLYQGRLMPLLQAQRALLAARYRHTREALREGNVTTATATPDLVALQGVKRQIDDLARQRATNRIALNEVLGLAADAEPRLVGEATVRPLDEAKVRGELPQLARRRPDLLALEAGYRSQEERLRAAVLAQFPLIGATLTRARDTSNLYTLGFGVTLLLPLFNRNRGAIALQTATRQQLYDDYRRRLAQAASEVEGILAQQRLLQARLASVNASIGPLEHAAAESESALRTGDVGELAYVNLRTALLDARAEGLMLEQRLLEQRVALQALSGGEVPARSAE